MKLPHHSTPARLLGKQISEVNIFIALLVNCRISKNSASPDLHPTTSPIINNDDLIYLGIVIVVPLHVVFLQYCNNYEATINLFVDDWLAGLASQLMRCLHRVHRRYVPLPSDITRGSSLFHLFSPYFSIFSSILQQVCSIDSF